MLCFRSKPPVFFNTIQRPVSSSSIHTVDPVSISFAPTKLFASTRFGNLANSNFVRYPNAFDTSSVGGVDALALIVSNETLSTL